ncbi:MAG: gluconokinase [Anaerolineaceae bacterium]|nr:gluconokinase [Anaerolineaceae bacterium]
MFLIVMGVSGCGKSTVGKGLAEELGWPFYDGDDFHPAENVAKMSKGIPLNDEDRAGWLAALADLIRSSLAQGKPGVLACSALKQKYRDQLCVDAEQVKFIYLKGSYELIKARMLARPGHYMKPGMLDSQFATLEEPQGALTVDIDQSPQQTLEFILKNLHLPG